MVFHAIGACMLARLMRSERGEDLDSDWLLFGPTDAEVVEPQVANDLEGQAGPLLYAAE